MSASFVVSTQTDRNPERARSFARRRRRLPHLVCGFGFLRPAHIERRSVAASARRLRISGFGASRSRIDGEHSAKG
jgi:hypothetical protein